MLRFNFFFLKIATYIWVEKHFTYHIKTRNFMEDLNKLQFYLLEEIINRFPKRVDAIEQLGFRSGVFQIVERRQRLHQRDEIVRTQLVHELRQGVSQRQRDLRALGDVIVVEKDRQQPHSLLKTG